MRAKVPLHPRQPRARLLCAAVALGVLLAARPGAEGHAGHDTVAPVDLTFTIRGTEVTALIDLEKWQLVTWGEPPKRFVDLQPAVPPALAVQKLMTRLEVAIDGAVVEPVLRTFGDPPFDPKVVSPHVKLAVAYPVTKRPTSLRVTWKDFFGIYWESDALIPLLIEADAQVDSVTLTKSEPEYIWNRRPPAAFRSAAPTLPEPAQGSRLPLLPLALAGLALLLPFLGPLARRRGLSRWAPSALALSTGAVVFFAGVGAVETPWGRPLPPTETQARSIVTSLLNNVYRAMDAKSEGEIYDLLSASVERPILDGLYGDIYESLLLRDQGGVIARVEEVTPTEIAIGHPEKGVTTQFTSTATWLLKAAVSHQGHTHHRQNQYRAEIVVRHDGTAWRIASVTMLERKRLDDGRGGLLDTPKDIPEVPPAPSKPAAPSPPAPAALPAAPEEPPKPPGPPPVHSVTPERPR